MAPYVLSLGELLAEVMRATVDQPLSQSGEFVGPYPSGAPAIFTDAVARLGLPASFVGVIGDDDFGQCVINRLCKDGVDTHAIRIAEGYTTGIAFIAYRSDGSRSYVFHMRQSASALLSPDDVPQDLAAHAAFVHVTGSALSIGESARQACYKAATACKEAGGKVSFDPNIRSELLGIDRVRQICQPILTICDLLLPSGAEAAMLTGNADAETACRSLLAGGIPMVALKQGEKGSTVFTAQQVIEAPPLAVREVDPTGAGDCYDAAFVVGLLEGWDLVRIAHFANVAGALSVTRRGPMEGNPRRADVLEYL